MLNADDYAGRTVVIVEGVSDQVALEQLARRLGRDLDAEGVSILPIGGLQSMGKFLVVAGPNGRGLRLAGLYDAGQQADLQRALGRAGFGSDLTEAEMEEAGFYACQPDLEDELIRTLGAHRVERVIEEQGELRSFRSFQNQPAQRTRSVEEQLHRFMGTRSGRKARYARALVDALDLSQIPRPLDRVLSSVNAPETPG